MQKLTQEIKNNYSPNKNRYEDINRASSLYS